MGLGEVEALEVQRRFTVGPEGGGNGLERGNKLRETWSVNH